MVAAIFVFQGRKGHDMVDLTGQVAFVSGASRGIGEAISRALVAAGAKVVLAARSTGAVEALAEELGPNAMALACDVADWASVTDAVAATEAAFGPVDIMVANAGVIDPISRLDESDPAGWGMAIDINVKGVYHVARAVLPQMVSRGSGRIITIGSGAAHNPLEGWSHYCTSKAAALMITRAIDKEARDAGVLSINLSPGTVATEMQRQIGASGLNPVSQMDFSEHKPASVVGEAVVLLAGPMGQAHAGKEIHVNDMGLSW